MKLSIKDIVNSDAYMAQAEAWSKSHIFVALAVSAYVIFLTDFAIGWNLVWEIIILFGSSLLIAMPTMFINVWLASLMSPHMAYAPPQKPQPINYKGRILKIAKDGWSIASLCLTAFITYKLLEWWGT